MPEIYEPWKAFPLFSLIHDKFTEEGFESILRLDPLGDAIEEQIYKLQNEKYIDVYLHIYTNEKKLKCAISWYSQQSRPAYGPKHYSEFYLSELQTPDDCDEFFDFLRKQTQHVRAYDEYQAFLVTTFERFGASL